MPQYTKPIEGKEESFAYLEHQRRTLGLLITAAEKKILAKVLCNDFHGCGRERFVPQLKVLASL